MSELTNPDPATDQEPKTTSTPDCGTCPFRKKAMEDAEKEKAQPRNGKSLFAEISNLKISARAKAELAILCARAKKLGRAIISFVRRHKHICENAVIGAILAHLMLLVPGLLGSFLALATMALSVSNGVLRELQESLAALFTAETAYA